MANKDRLKLITGVLLIFFTGIATGHFGTVYYFKNKFYNQGPPPLHVLIKNRLSHELRLTDAQQVKFDKIVSNAEKNFDAFREKHHSEVKSIFTDCFKQINDILTPAQQKKFKRIKNRFEHRIHSPGDMPPHEKPGNRLPPTNILKKQLNLSADQVKNIIPIIREFNRKVDTHGPNAPMHTPPEGKPGMPPDDFHEAPGQSMTSPPTPPDDDFRKEYSHLITQIKPYLNAAQLKKIEEIINTLPSRPEEIK